MLIPRKTVIALAVLALVGSGAAEAYRARVSAEGRSVTINGRVALRFHAPNGALSTEERATVTVQRLEQLVAQGFPASGIQASGDSGQGKVLAGSALVCIATAADAKANNTTPAALASRWAATIRALMALPPIALEPSQLLVPLGENRIVSVGGAAAGPATVRSDNAVVATAQVSEDGRYIQVSGQQPGITTIEVSVENERAYLTVTVRKYAGSVASIEPAIVTGNPSPASNTAYAARQAVMHCAVLEPGARIDLGNVSAAQPTAPGQERVVKVNVRIEGDGYIPYSTVVPVTVRNVDMPRDSAAQLFYSNNPERLLKYQTLFVGRLEIESATRVLYHHQNMIGKRVHLILEIINPNPLPASFRVFRGVSSPHVDTVMVGHVAGNAFLRDMQNNVSIVDNVPAQSRLVLVSDFMEHKQTSSGILQIRQMGGAPAYVRITAAQPYVDNVSVGTIASAPDPFIMQLSAEVYPGPVKQVEADYTVGGRWAFISIGRHALTDNTAARKLLGNYGVTYDISVKLQNPTADRKKVTVLFEPSAGLASGVFLVEGKIVMAKYAQPPAEVPIISYMLAPGEERSVRIQTVPLAGSNYPATIVVRS